MGVYINPNNCSKEDWLARNGTYCAPPDGDDWWGKLFNPQVELPVCLIRNTMSSAAGVAFSKRECEAFADPSDGRPHYWYIVPIEVLYRDMPRLKSQIEGYQSYEK